MARMDHSQIRTTRTKAAETPFRTKDIQIAQNGGDLWVAWHPAVGLPADAEEDTGHALANARIAA